MKNTGIIIGGKTLSHVSKLLNLGHGSTWPGHIALRFNKNFIQDILRNSTTKIIFIAGTNGKTTTTSLIKHILEQSGRTVMQNTSGANLLNGIASSLLLNASIDGKLHVDYVLFEVDENTFSSALKIITPDAILLLNLFRDQLDRYGEVNSIAQNWLESLKKLSHHTQLFANADDPQIAFLGKSFSEKTIYFGLEKEQSLRTTHEHATDSTYCPQCGKKLTYTSIFYSHLGIWNCTHCNLTRPEIKHMTTVQGSLTGTYNLYNMQSAMLLATFLGVAKEDIAMAVKHFKPVFGRQEKLIYQGKKIEVVLAKNPTGFNESLRTVKESKGKNIVLLLNDNVADGHDVSWIWDVDFDLLKDTDSVAVSGTRAYDLAVRLKYAGIKQVSVYGTIPEALIHAVTATSSSDTLFILPTYTAMLEVRKELTGKKIL